MSETKHIQDLLDSGRMEQFVVGVGSNGERSEVQDMIYRHADVAAAYEQAQRDLWMHAKANEVAPDPETRETILSAVLPDVSVPRNRDVYNKSWFNNWLATAATLLLLVSAGALVYTNFQNATLRDQLAADEVEIEQLDSQLIEAEEKNRKLSNERNQLANYNTEKLALNNADNSIKAVVYYSKKNDFAEIVIEKLHPLDADQDYQLWADVNGEMISLAVLDQSINTVALDHNILETAESINLTIEKAGGSDHATVENLVANVMINSKP